MYRYPPFSDEPTKTIFEKILSERAEMPEYFRPEARDLIEKLLVVDHTRRLGCMKGGTADIKNHPWFRGIDWDGLLQKKYVGPLNPGLQRDGDTHNFYKYSDVNVQEEPDDGADYDKIFAFF
jgi:protein kinase X